MAKVITQDTFNECVSENSSLFDMGLQEAITETVNQFKSQGVDLTNIIIDPDFIEGEDVIQIALDHIDEALTEPSELDHEFIIDSLNLMAPLLTESIAYRMHMGSLDGLTRIFNLMKVVKDAGNVYWHALEVARLLLTGYPDLLTQEFAEFVIKELDSQKDNVIVKKILEVLKVASTMDENNRQIFFDLGIDKKLEKLLTPETDVSVIAKVSKCIAALAQDDDIRVAISAHHIHCCSLALSLLTPLTDLMKGDTSDVTLVVSIFKAMRAILVRSEFCEIVNKEGGVTFILIILGQHSENEVVLSKGFLVLSALAGNDNVKSEIVSCEISGVITSALQRFINSPKLCASVLALISKLALRNSVFGKAFYKEEGFGLLTQAMARHKDCQKTQMFASWCIRNIVSRNSRMIAPFLELGVEDMIKKAAIAFPVIEEDCLAALRDLKCDVDFTERWTGEIGDKLEHD